MGYYYSVQNRNLQRGVPNIETIVSLDDKGTTCHNVNSNEAEEDGFMKAYDHTLLPRMYGTNKTTTIKTPAKCPPGYKNPTADVNNKNYCYAGWSPLCVIKAIFPTNPVFSGSNVSTAFGPLDFNV